MIEGRATARYVRGSSQKAKLVIDRIRGRDVNAALAILRYSPKRVARDISKVLRSAVANVQQTEGASGDVDRLYVRSCHANQGPSMKRVRAAPMGRAFRIIKRSAHLTVVVREREESIVPVAASPSGEAGAPRPKRKTAKAKRSKATASRSARARKTAAKKTAKKASKKAVKKVAKQAAKKATKTVAKAAKTAKTAKKATKND